MSLILSKIEAAGFSLSLDSGDIIVTPPGQLSDDQRAYLTRNKTEIVSALKARELKESPSGNDHPPANDSSDDQVERLKALPSDLVRLAIRYCVELHADSPEQVLEMLEDVLAVPDEWYWWRIHLMKKLRIPTEVQCVDCGHCEDSGGNLGRCFKSVQAPGASGLWWMTDQHPCIEFSAAKEAT